VPTVGATPRNTDPRTRHQELSTVSENRISHLPIHLAAGSVRIALTGVAVVTILLVLLLAVVSRAPSTVVTNAPRTSPVSSDYSCPLTADQVWTMVQQHRPLPRCHDRASMGGYPEAEQLMP
jgi:Na+-transporting methylmalonyl-CoA/oxaloacetate decarboxylase gamma subunit